MSIQSVAILSMNESVTNPTIKLCELDYCKIETRLTWNYTKNAMDERM